jgi:hypothetical protein
MKYFRIFSAEWPRGERALGTAVLVDVGVYGTRLRFQIPRSLTLE